MRLTNFAALSSLIAFVSGKQISGVFKSFDSLKHELDTDSDIAAPDTPSWIATLGWKLDNSDAMPGDTFTLNMPCVFKFTTTSEVTLQADGVTYATCSLHNGEIIVPYSTVECTVTNNIRAVNSVSGAVYFPFTFNAGGSSGENDLKGAKCFKKGSNTITFYDGDNSLSTSASFQGESKSTISTLFYSQKLLPDANVFQEYAIAGECKRGYKSGTLGIDLKNADIDCATAKAAITDQVNAWGYPQTADDFSFTSTCSSSSFIIKYSNIPAGNRPYISLLSTIPGTNKNNLYYTDKYTCNDGSEADNSLKFSYTNYKNGESGSNGKVVRIVTSTYTGSTTRVTTLPYSTTSGATETVVVEVPIPTTTLTSTWSGSITTTTTKTGTPGGTASVIIEVPSAVTTRTTEWTGSYTTTHTDTDVNGTNTVVIETPRPTVTITTPWTGTFTSTFTNSGNDTDTVVIEVPSSSQFTSSLVQSTSRLPWNSSVVTSTNQLPHSPSSNTNLLISSTPNFSEASKTSSISSTRVITSTATPSTALTLSPLLSTSTPFSASSIDSSIAAVSTSTSSKLPTRVSISPEFTEVISSTTLKSEHYHSTHETTGTTHQFQTTTITDYTFQHAASDSSMLFAPSAISKSLDHNQDISSLRLNPKSNFLTSDPSKSSVTTNLLQSSFESEVSVTTSVSSKTTNEPLISTFQGKASINYVSKYCLAILAVLFYL